MKLKILIYILLNTVILAQITFDANFDSGNLASVSTTDSISYTVKSVEDIGGRWFYFRISGVKDKLIKVTITNSDVNRPMYSYNNLDFVRFSETESPKVNYFEKLFENDTVFVAYYTPYSYNYLQERLAEWGNSEFVKIDTLGFTEHNFPVQEIVLTDSSVPDENKLRVWIHSRTHPSETPSSWHFDGIMQELLKNDEAIDYYRKNIIFYLYPFNNPEGVYYGRSRTNYYGVDQERDWNFPDNETTSAVLLLKNRMKQINDEKVISVALNLHSQAAPYPTFWIHTASSTSAYFYRREYQFTNLAISDLPYFIKSDYRESNLQSYFPEGFMWSNYGDEILALTYETPYDQYSNGEWVTNENLFQFGATTVYGIAEFLELSSSQRIILDNNSAQASGFWNSTDSGKDFYGNDFYYINSGFGDNKITFQTEIIESGIYDVYAWWTSNSANATNAKFVIGSNGNENIIEKSQQTKGGQWNLLSNVELFDTSKIEITLTDEANGTVVADAIRVIYRGPVVGVKDNQIAETFELFQNYPNPFNPTTTIKFKLKNAENVKLNIFNSLGQLVETLVNDNLGKGNHEVIFSSNKNNLSSGIYYYQLITDTYSQTKGMILLK
ncbi:MAG: T9SS type A sorting domain-containing protein [Bacteroidetes bacterium]|nr:T9SS type A sorting domain-containing protein [Bacteroidota bacterium]MBU1117278.1 T9SS type A sorting domain-containing protein [Bacteroidota bacterium]MBU1797382.1 T9SS type A sorting domain-containing protein [Bacteroidota bacterium]